MPISADEFQALLALNDPATILEGLRDYDRAGLRPGQAEAISVTCLDRLGRFEEVVDAAVAAEATVEAPHLRAHIEARHVRALTELDRLDEAVRIGREAAARHTASPDLRLRLVVALARAGLQVEARDLARSVRLEHPENAEAWMLHGLTEEQVGNRLKARWLLRQARNLDPARTLPDYRVTLRRPPR